jgi:hypothetical protein
MKFLLDTNVLIPAEPTSPAHVEKSSPVVTELLGMLEQGRHQIYAHPDSVAELLEHDRDVARRETRRLLLQKYITLPAPPSVSTRLRSIVGDARPGSHDAVDHALLAAAEGNAVHYIVTNDVPLLRKAKRAGLDDRVVSAGDALAIVRGLFPIAPPPPPAVDRVFAHELDEADPIFDSFRQDYQPDFDEWLARCKLAHRTAFAIRVGAPLAGVSILKEEDDHPYDLEGRILKVCSFKIADAARVCLPLRPIGLTPPAAGIRDAVHQRAAPSPPCLRSAAAHS